MGTYSICVKNQLHHLQRVFFVGILLLFKRLFISMIITTVLQYVSRRADDIYDSFFSQSNIIFIVWWVFSLFYLVFFYYLFIYCFQLICYFWKTQWPLCELWLNCHWIIFLGGTSFACLKHCGSLARLGRIWNIRFLFIDFWRVMQILSQY